MSIVDSLQELEEAKARLAEATPDQLSEDRFQEAQHWTGLIATELRSRRDARAGVRPPAMD